MTCCADDIQYCGLVSKVSDISKVSNSAWYNVTAEIDIRFSRLYGKKGPVFYVKSLEIAEPPVEQVATFY